MCSSGNNMNDFILSNHETGLLLFIELYQIDFKLIIYLIDILLFIRYTST